MNNDAMPGSPIWKVLPIEIVMMIFEYYLGPYESAYLGRLTRLVIS